MTKLGQFFPSSGNYDGNTASFRKNISWQIEFGNLRNYQIYVGKISSHAEFLNATDGDRCYRWGQQGSIYNCHSLPVPDSHCYNLDVSV